MTISPSGDVLVIEAACPSRYPTVNNSVMGSHRSGKKTPGYHDLFNAILAEAKDAIENGWKMVEHPCRVTLDRFVPDGRVADAINQGQTEFNALTAGGVWADDTLAQDVRLGYHPNSEGFDRVLIIITRLPAPVGAVARKPRLRRASGKTAAKTTNVVTPEPAVDYALLNGKPIPMAEALALINKT